MAAHAGNAFIKTKHHLIDDRFSIPHLDDHFTQITHVVCSWVHGNFVIFYHPRTHVPRGIELIIFRRSTNKRKLVDLKAADCDLITVTISAYVQPAFLFQTLIFLKLLQSLGEPQPLQHFPRPRPCYLGMNFFICLYQFPS